MSKKRVKVLCEECDSEYSINFELGSTSETSPLYCSFCGEELVLDSEEDE